MRLFLDLLQLSGRPKLSIAALLFLVVLAACGSPRDAAASNPEHAVVEIAIPRDVATLNPLISDTDDEFYVEEAIFDGLLKFDANGRLIPDLATTVPSRANGGISADLKTITYRLRRDVVWQDGSPFTSSDVAFTYRMLMSDRVASPQRSLYVQVASLKTPSPFTVVVRLRKPSVTAIAQLFVAGPGFIVPEHILRRVADMRRSLFNASPVGTGPFAVQRWKRGEAIELVANDRYFEGRPRVRALHLRIVPDPVTRTQLLTTGAVDLSSVAASAVSSLESVPGMRVVQGRSTDLYYLDLNTRRAPLNDRTVRAALAAAIDRRRLVSMLGSGFQTANSLIPGGRECTKAAQPGTIRAPNGVKLHLQITYPSTPMMEHIALVLQQTWKKIGVDATLRPLPFALLYGDGGAVTTGQYDVAIDGLGVPTQEDIAPIIAADSAPPNGFNYSRYANANVDRWLAMADGTDDERDRARFFEHVQDALCRDAPVIPLVWGTYTYAFNSRLRGFAAEPIVSDLWNVTSWSLH